jgi:hypothetical protein
MCVFSAGTQRRSCPLGGALWFHAKPWPLYTFVDSRRKRRTHKLENCWLTSGGPAPNRMAISMLCDLFIHQLGEIWWITFCRHMTILWKSRVRTSEFDTPARPEEVFVRPGSLAWRWQTNILWSWSIRRSLRKNKTRANSLRGKH